MLSIILTLILFQIVLTENTASNIDITLTPGQSINVDLPTQLQGYQKYTLSTFTHKDNLANSMICQLQPVHMSQYKRMGAFIQQRQVHKNDFWEGGNIWDVSVSGNRIICVFESGQVTQLRYKKQSPVFKPFENKSTTRPLEGKVIPFGKILTFQESQVNIHTLYFSQQGCYHINQDGSWTKLSGYEGILFQAVKNSNQKIYVVNQDNIAVYAVDLMNYKLRKEQELSIFFTEDNITHPLYISDLEIDSKNKKIYLIDLYEGIKYLSISEELSQQAINLLPSQRCQDILIAGQIILFSCSYLIVANSTDLSFIKQVRYPFHISSIFYDEGYFTAFGDSQYAIYSIMINRQSVLDIEYVLKGNLPNNIYDRFLYIPKSQYYLLFSKEQIEYGKIINNQYSLLCSFINIAHQNNYQQMIGSHNGSLQIHGKCRSKQYASSFQFQCKEYFHINVEVSDLKRYKWILWIFIGLTLVLFISIGGYKLTILMKKKNSIVYSQFNEQTVVTDDVSKSKQFQQNQKNTQIELPKV